MANLESGESGTETKARPGIWARVFARLKPPGWFPYLILGLGIALSLEAWRFSAGLIEGQLAAEMKDRATQAKSAFDRHVLDYVYAAHKLQGALEASDSITRKDFSRYVHSGGIADTFPGFLTLQFVRYVPGAARARFLDEVRSDRSLEPAGYPNFAIRPGGDRAEYLVVDFIEPLQGHEAAFGLDVLSVPEQRAAAERARDSGQAIATAPLPSGSAGAPEADD